MYHDKFLGLMHYSKLTEAVEMYHDMFLGITHYNKLNTVIFLLQWLYTISTMIKTQSAQKNLNQTYY